MVSIEHLIFAAGAIVFRIGLGVDVNGAGLEVVFSWMSHAVALRLRILDHRPACITRRACTKRNHLMSSLPKSFTPADAAIVLVDHQPGVLHMVGSLPANIVTANAGLLARLGEELGVPTVVTSTRENLEFLGTNLSTIQTGAPKAYAARIRRDGTLNAFNDPAFAAAVKNTGRRNLVMSGLLTDVCLQHSVISALEAGYHVQVVADASGTTTQLADDVTHDRMRSLGAVVTTAYGVLFAMYPDFSTPDGKKAEAVANASLPAAA